MRYLFGDYVLDTQRQELHHAGELITLRRKVFQVLVYLVAHRERVVPKQELLEHLWPEQFVSDEALTSCVKALRQALGERGRTPRFVRTLHGQGYRFVAAVEEREPLPADGAPHALPHHRGEGTTPQVEVPSPLFSPPLAETGSTSVEALDGEHKPVTVLCGALAEALTLAVRLGPEVLHHLMRGVLAFTQHTVQRYEGSIFQVPGEGTARRVLALSWRKGTLALVGLLLLLGGGVTVWQRSVRLPAPARVVPATQAPTVAVPETPSIVVLPFVNLSGDPEQEYFSDGITEDLTFRLSRLAGLSVISSHSAFTYKDKAVKVQEVSRELGVRYVLEGSVRKAGDQVRITAQLIDATTDRHLWAERYDRPLTDIFALQDALVQKMVTTLQLQLSLWEQGILVRRPQENLEAYDAFLRGLASFYRFTKEGNAQARQLFEHAVALDPTYAEAYAFLGLTYRLEWGNRWSQDPQALERAFELAHKALALDDALPWAYALLSWIYDGKQQREQALAAAERAVALEPSNADSYAVQSSILLSMGRSEEALRQMEKAMRLNPRYPAWYLGVLARAYIITGRSAEAIPVLNTRLLRNPNHEGSYLLLANAYSQQWAAQLSQDPEMLAQALAAVQRALVLRDDASDNHRTLGYVYLWQQQYEPALAEMERAIALEPDEARGSAAFNYAGWAVVLSRMGRAEEALGAAEKALRLKPTTVDRHLASVGMAYALAGRPEQALAPLQRFLSRYPNMLEAHLTLAAVYSELGREAEARAEAAEVLRLNPHFSLEVHRQREPLKDPAQLEHQLTALRRAGLR